ncbi:MAG: glycosyltransferase [Acidobacteriota bacterium]|nr:glycosyltransferase [Acidobacteriota bacterium]
MPTELSIIIVNWNGSEFLRRCIESIAKAPPQVSYDIIVVDNASTDDSVRWLRSDEAKMCLGKARLHVLENAENLGFSRANNQGIEHSKALFLFLLNSDTEVRPGAIDALIATLKSDERAGMCGPRLVNPDDSLQPSVYRNPPAAWEILLSGSRLYRLLPAGVRGELLLGGHWDHARRRRVPRLSGAAMMVKREVIDSVGGLDERFHMYGEDVEWCLRIARTGWLLIFEPDAIVMHHGSQSSRKRWDNLETERRIIDGQLRFQRYCLSRWRLISNLLASSAVASTAHTWRSIRGRSTDKTGMALGLYAKHLKEALWRK